MEWLTSNWGTIIAVVTGIISVASLIAKITPTQVDDGWMLKILKLREKAKTELGDDFDIRAFHDTILGGGAVPLSTLVRMVDDWIAESQASE